MRFMQRHLRLHRERDPSDVSASPIGASESRSSGRSVTALLKRWSKRWPADQTIAILDIATGSVEVPVMVRRWALGGGFDVRVICAVARRRSLELGRERVREASQSDSRLGSGIELQLVDALKLTEVFEPNSFDYVHAGSLLCELHEIELMTALRIMDRLASRGIIWTGSVRSRAGRAGFTRRSVLDYAKRLDLTYCQYSSRLFSTRFTLSGEKK